MEKIDVREWVAAYGRAWREKDDRALSGLFREYALYRSGPTREPHRGREAIHSYWRRATAGQEDLDLRFGKPVVSADGRRAAVEWWATMRDEEWAAGEGRPGRWLTLPGCLVLAFSEDGRCEELREYWHAEFGGPYRPRRAGASEERRRARAAFRAAL